MTTYREVGDALRDATDALNRKVTEATLMYGFWQNPFVYELKTELKEEGRFKIVGRGRGWRYLTTMDREVLVLDVPNGDGAIFYGTNSVDEEDKVIGECLEKAGIEATQIPLKEPFFHKRHFASLTYTYH